MINLISLLVLLGGYFLSRYILREAEKKLSVDEKSQLLKLAPNPVITQVIVLGMLFITIAYLNSSSFYMTLVGNTAFLLFIFYATVRGITTYIKLKKIVTTPFLNAYVLASIINVTTIILFILLQLSPGFLDIYKTSENSSSGYECFGTQRMQEFITFSKPGEVFVKKDMLNRDWMVKVPSTLTPTSQITEFFVAYWSPVNAGFVCSYKVNNSNDLVTISSDFPIPRPSSSSWVADENGALICKDKKENCRFK